jgi:hypothetical protein
MHRREQALKTRQDLIDRATRELESLQPESDRLQVLASRRVVLVDHLLYVWFIVSRF